MAIADNRVLSTNPDNFNSSTVLGLAESREWHDGLLKTSDKKMSNFANSIFKQIPTTVDGKPAGLIARERKIQRDRKIFIKNDEEDSKD